MNAAALADARLLQHRLAHGGYALAYGSHADGRAHPCSDLDLLFVTGHGLPAPVTDSLITSVKALHHRHGLDLDEEVDYAVKLAVTADEVDAALALGGFTVDERGDLTVEPVTATPEWLNSPKFRLRLVLNALTTAHVFLGGDVELYRVHVAAADTAAALLALSLLDMPRVRLRDAADALARNAEHGASGPDWLGYRPGGALMSLLHRGFATLATTGLVRLLDGEHLEQDQAARRRHLLGHHRDSRLATAYS